MNMLNSLIIEGVVVGEPHKVEASQVLNFTISVERYYKNRAGEGVTETSQFKVVAFGTMSELPLKDGMSIRLVGRLKQNTWVDGGVTHSEVQVVAEHIELRKTK